MSQSKIYVGNLSYGTTESMLEDFFNKYGQIAELKLITDRETGRSKGFAFVTFEDQKAAQSAVEADGTELDGRRLKISIAREERSGGGGGRGGMRSAGGGAGRGRGNDSRRDY